VKKALPQTSRTTPRSPGCIVLLYAAAAALWTAVSDHLLHLFLHEADHLEQIGIGKGFLFIGVTSTLLFLVLRNWDRSIAEASAAATRYHERLERMLKSANDGWWDWDLAQNSIYYSPRWWEMLGYAPDELPVDPELWQRLLHPDDAGRARRLFFGTLESGEPCDRNCSIEVRMRHRDGHYLPIFCRYQIQCDAAGKPAWISGANIDLTRIKQSESQLEFLARRDPLTQLPNRVFLLSQLDQAIRTARHDNGRLALLMLGLTRFKTINESFGHVAGDDLLQQVARRLSERFGGKDMVARFGGDEFVVMLRAIGHPKDAGLVADELINDLRRPWTLSNGAELRIGASIGISVFPEHGSTTAELLQHADAALYQAKSEGRGRYHYFSHKLTRAARERIDLEARLHRAIEQQELCVFYQPQVEIAGRRIVGAEALLRWRHPQLGLVPPAHFIAIAETSGLIGAIGAWVLQETCDQGRRWMDAGMAPLTLAVNLSPRQFVHADVEAMVTRGLLHSGFPADRLELELTEGALMERQEDAAQLLHRLRDIGVRLALDDFGTGYSSLAHLKRFPLDVLKIDKSFVEDLPHEACDTAIASTIITLGHSLGFQVLAEGVENDGQLAFLKTQGCDLYQGYLLSRPLPAEEFARLVASSAGAC
jgi:diguanylate cyclase (GGDEF)-like protein/PAS domain S-box-containing protein